MSTLIAHVVSIKRIKRFGKLWSAVCSSMSYSWLVLIVINDIYLKSFLLFYNLSPYLSPSQYSEKFCDPKFAICVNYRLWLVANSMQQGPSHENIHSYGQQSSCLCGIWRCITVFIEACLEQGDSRPHLHFLFLKSKLNISLSYTPRSPISATHLPYYPILLDLFIWIIHGRVLQTNKSHLIMLNVNYYFQSQLFGIVTGRHVDELHSGTLYSNICGCKFSEFFFVWW